jgi:hypothetical protein
MLLEMSSAGMFRCDSPNFFLDESALVTGVRARAMATMNYLAGAKTD